MLDLNNLNVVMREYIKTNLEEIENYFKKRKKIVSKMNKISITQEFEEWSKKSDIQNELIWTLPDLTHAARLKNFCRSIKKEIK